MRDKPAKVVYKEGTSEIYEHVETKRNYVFIRHEAGDLKLHKFVPWHEVSKVIRRFDTSESPSTNITGERGMD